MTLQMISIELHIFIIFIMVNLVVLSIFVSTQLRRMTYMYSIHVCSLHVVLSTACILPNSTA